MAITYDVPITFTNTENSGFYAGKNTAKECDTGNSIETWIEIGNLKHKSHSYLLPTIIL